MARILFLFALLVAAASAFVSPAAQHSGESRVAVYRPVV